MPWEVDGADQFADWYWALSDDEQLDVGRVVEMLVEHGPSLPFPYSSGISTSKHRHMRELRIQHAGRPYRVLYAFDPRRAARSFSLEATRPVRTAGTRNTCPLPTRSTTSTWSR